MMTLQELAERLNLPVKGNLTLVISGLKDLERKNPASAFSREHNYYVEHANALQKHADLTGAMVLTSTALADKFEHAIICEPRDSRLKFIELLEIFSEKPGQFSAASWQGLIANSASIAASASIYPGAVIMEKAVIEDNCLVYPGAVIETGAMLGAGSIVYPNAVVGRNCRIGRENILHSGVVIGADGFGFYDKDGVRYKIPHIGNVVTGDHVEIGANSSIDRATIESTTIGNFTKIDDQVHIGHNCQIGNYVYIAGNSGISGSTVLEDQVIVAGQSGVADHLRLREKSVILAMTGVGQDIEPGQVYFGLPARPVRETHKINSALAYLPELLRRMRKLEKDSGHEENSGH